MVMSDRIALLRSGELEQVSTPREIYSHPATSYVAQFIGHTNLLRGNVRGGVVGCGPLSWPADLPDGPVQFSLRPESLRMAPAGDGRQAIRVRGRIVHHAFQGATELIRVECADALLLTMRSASGRAPSGEVELEFSVEDAVPVRESPERI